MTKLTKSSSLILVTTFVGVAVFFVKSWVMANSQLSVGDEGAYLFKGFAFARGDYRPFQEYGFWTNKAPLAFLIPGYIQYWFGPGLRTGRYFALFLNFFTLLGTWVVANRLGGKKWAAVAIWVFALTDWQIVTLSQALSQGIIACLMTWMLVLVLEGKRELWHFIAASVISILIIMTRQNMAPVPVLLILYIFWMYGRKAGIISATVMVTLFSFFVLLYGRPLWDLWFDWIPRLLNPLDRIVSTTQNISGPVEITRLPARIQASVEDVQRHLFIVAGSFSALILWRPKREWKDPVQYGTAVFLGAAYFILFILHIWGSIFNEFCVWCLFAYQTFYNPAGLFFVILFFANYTQPAKWQVNLLVSFILIISGAIGIYYYSYWGNWLLKNIPVPLAGRLIETGKFDTVPLREIFRYLLIDSDLYNRLASFIGGLLVGILFLLLIWVLYRGVINKTHFRMVPFTNVVLAVFIFTGTLLPISVENRIGLTACGTNFLTYYEQTARDLAELIPPHALVFWKPGGRSMAFMLYMTDVRFFPPQIDAGGGSLTEHTNRDPEYMDSLLKRGQYNSIIEEKWLDEADYYVVWSEFYDVNARQFFEQPAFVNIPYDMGELSKCEDQLLVFTRR